MESTGALLWKAVRKPMWQWYRRTGVWWLVAIVAAYFLYLVQDSLPWSPVTRFAYWVEYLWNLPGLIVLGAWLHAAEVMDELAIQHFERAAAAPLDLLRCRFWLAYLQGVIPLLSVFVAWCLIGVRYQARLGTWSPFDAHAWLEATSVSLRHALYVAWPMTWCVAILLLLPSRRVLAWLLALVPWVSELLAAEVRDLVPSPAGGLVRWYQSSHAIEVLEYAVAAAVLLAMLVAYRRGMVRLAVWLYWLILMSRLAAQPLDDLCRRGVGGAALPFAYAVGWIAHCFGWPPRFYTGWIAYSATNRSLGETALIHVSYVPKDLWMLLWLAVALCVVHAWILAPERTKPDVAVAS